jgi:REP element-mobilizing transposase RayT
MMATMEVDVQPFDALPVRKPLRLPDYDYAGAGMYFITICLHYKEPRFGVLVDDGVLLNAAGQMVANTWQSNIQRYPAAALDTFVVMPDHLHAIVFLKADSSLSQTRPTLSRIVQSFKSLTTVDYIRGVRAGHYPEFERVLWQRSFNDTILWDDRQLIAAQWYIEDNPRRAHERMKVQLWSQESHSDM